MRLLRQSKRAAGFGIAGLRRRFQVWKTGVTFRGSSVELFPLYYPNSNQFWSYPELTYSAINALPEQMQQLLRLPSNNEADRELTLPTCDPSRSDFLGHLFDYFESDKREHGYHLLYAPLLTAISGHAPHPALLEIGIGTNNTRLVSNMGLSGSPGASLRSFRAWDPLMRVFGADVDKTILFDETGIVTAFVDQLKPETYDSMCADLQCSRFDIIIDDGLHNPEANLNSVLWGLRHLNVGGFLVVEDIPDRTVPVWQLVKRILSLGGLESCIWRGTSAHAFVVRVGAASAETPRSA